MNATWHVTRPPSLGQTIAKFAETRPGIGFPRVTLCGPIQDPELRFGPLHRPVSNAKKAIGGHRRRKTSFTLLQDPELKEDSLASAVRDELERGREGTTEHYGCVCGAVSCLRFSGYFVCSGVSTGTSPLPLVRGVSNSRFLFLFFFVSFSLVLILRNDDVGLCTPHKQPLPEGRGSPRPGDKNTISTSPRPQEPVVDCSQPVTAS